MARDVEIELNYDSMTVTITTAEGVYDYDWSDEILTKVDFLVKGGAGYSVYSQEVEEWIPEYVTFEE